MIYTSTVFPKRVLARKVLTLFSRLTPDSPISTDIENH